MYFSISGIVLGQPFIHNKKWKCKYPVPCVSVDPAKARTCPKMPPFIVLCFFLTS